MSDALAELATLRWLTPDESRRVLAETAATGGPVCLYADDECTAEVWSASIVGIDQEHLLLAGRAGDALPLTRDMSSMLRAEILLGGARYQFDIECLNTGTDLEPGSLKTACPDRIAVVDRRRCRRRRLHASAVVTIRTAEAPEMILCRAAMMNVSVDGLACRISRADAEELAGVPLLAVQFQMEDESQAFALMARAAATTPTSDPDRFILGMEFVENSTLTSERERLGAFLGDVQ